MESRLKKNSIILATSLVLVGCVVVRGTQQKHFTPKLEPLSNRDPYFMENLKKWTRAGDFFDDYSLKMSVIAILISSEMKDSIERELIHLYGKNLPPAAESLLENFKRDDCPHAFLIRAWDAVRREDPLAAKPRSWQVVHHGEEAKLIKAISELNGTLSQFIPYQINWGRWTLLCFSETSPVTTSSLDAGAGKINENNTQIPAPEISTSTANVGESGTKQENGEKKELSKEEKNPVISQIFFNSPHGIIELKW